MAAVEGVEERERERERKREEEVEVEVEIEESDEESKQEKKTAKMRKKPSPLGAGESPNRCNSRLYDSCVIRRRTPERESDEKGAQRRRERARNGIEKPRAQLARTKANRPSPLSLHLAREPSRTQSRRELTWLL